MISSTYEKALLVGIYASKRDRAEQEFSLQELQRLAATAGVSVVSAGLHELRSIHPPTYLGKGKVESLASEIKSQKIDVVIFDEDLSPSQTRNLEKEFGAKVIDRTGIILDIFAQRAQTQEGKIQVELAQLEYLLPKLIGKDGTLSQLGGGIGTRGPGETRLELDRRKARTRLTFLKRELKKVKVNRELHRKQRSHRPMALAALVGYTNAGKSTLMNRLTQANVLVEDKLFATLDPTVRRLRLPSGREILLSDTVGFVHKLPHQLIDAFRSTFEEVAAADLLIHLIDISHPNFKHQIKTVDGVLHELNLHHKPVLRVFNKADQTEEKNDGLISAKTGQGVDELLQSMDKMLSARFRPMSLLLPYQAGAELSYLYKTSKVLVRKDLPKGILLEVEGDEVIFQKFKKYTR